jgi:hypothetical protein
MGLHNMNKTLLLATAVTAAVFVAHGATAAVTGNLQDFVTVVDPIDVTLGGNPLFAGTGAGTGTLIFDDSGTFTIDSDTTTDITGLGVAILTTSTIYNGSIAGTTFTTDGTTVVDTISCVSVPSPGGGDAICANFPIGVASGTSPEFDLDICTGGDWATTLITGAAPGIVTTAVIANEAFPENPSEFGPGCEPPPDVPTNLTATPGDSEVTVSFLPGSAYGATITNYAYSLNGVDYTPLNPAQPGAPAGGPGRKITIAGLTNGTAYSITLKAISSAGSSVAASAAVDVTPVGPAGAPTGLLATPGDGEATITFTPGANNGAAITNYEYSVDGVSFDALNPAQAASPITIVGLINLQDYSITLRAINSAGSGAASIAVDVTPGKPALPPTPPDAPTGLSAAPGDSQATISFTPGANNRALITNYEYSLDGGPYTALSPAATDSPITITGLTNGTSYSITLKAINSEGSSVAASDAVEATPVAAATAPDAPTGLSATPGDGQATISFTPGADNGAAIANYEYSLDGGSYTPLSPASAGSPITIVGLTNGTPYSITLKAINSEGSSVAASAAVDVTPVAAATAPDAPTGLSATPGDGRATISFTPGSNNGAAITNYEYSLDGGSYTALNPAKANSPITIEGLTNDTPYSITLKAINSEGSSVAASAAVVATPVGPPLPPPPPPTPPTPGPAAPIPTMSAYGLGLTVLGVFVVAVRRLRTLAKPK